MTNFILKIECFFCHFIFIIRNNCKSPISSQRYFFLSHFFVIIKNHNQSEIVINDQQFMLLYYLLPSWGHKHPSYPAIYQTSNRKHPHQSSFCTTSINILMNNRLKTNRSAQILPYTKDQQIHDNDTCNKLEDGKIHITM